MVVTVIKFAGILFKIFRNAFQYFHAQWIFHLRFPTSGNMSKWKVHCKCPRLSGRSGLSESYKWTFTVRYYGFKFSVHEQLECSINIKWIGYNEIWQSLTAVEPRLQVSCKCYKWSGFKIAILVRNLYEQKWWEIDDCSCRRTCGTVNTRRKE